MNIADWFGHQNNSAWAACYAGLLVGAIGVAVFVKSRERKALLRDKRNLKSILLRDSVAQWRQLAFEKITAEQSEAIVSLPFNDLRQQLQEGLLTAVEVLHAYQRKAATENEKYNFVCEPVKEAEQMALACDTVVDKTSKPLLGIPISVKENFGMKGYDSTYGLSHRIFCPSEEHSAQVQVMINQGAVPFIRTNLPQTMLTFDSHNPIYGYTLNPHNPKRSCGGSSGGEGAALGCGASIIGLGSDIGGSLRIPAAWCGVCSLKPSWGRTAWPGLRTCCQGQGIVVPATGPMARTVDGLVALSQAFFSSDMFAQDPYLAPLPFATEVYSGKRPLRIGYLYDVGVIATAHSSKRAVMEAKAALQLQGHELVEWTPPRLEWVGVIAFAKTIFGDGGQSLLAGLKDDEVSSTLAEAVRFFSLPLWLRSLIVRCSRGILPGFMCQYLKSICGVAGVAEWWELQHEVDEYRKEVADIWRKLRLDAFICPVMPCPAMPLGGPNKCPAAVAYTLLFNLLNFPAGVLPVTKVSADDLARDVDFPATDPWHRVIKESLVDSVGLPVAVQFVALPFQEELCLRLMKEVEGALAAK